MSPYCMCYENFQTFIRKIKLSDRDVAILAQFSLKPNYHRYVIYHLSVCTGITK